MVRAISHSEVDALLGCQVRHAFAYTGRLTAGTALSPRTSAPILRDGRAWGAGVASYHSVGHGTVEVLRALEEDAAEQRAAGIYDQSVFDEALTRLMAMLDHYVTVDETRVPLVEREREILVPLRARSGSGRRSPLYRLHAFLDGIHIDRDGRVWIVEFKLRGRLQSLEQIILNRQIRWYAWAWRELTGIEPAGVIVDERLNALPLPVKINKDGRPSKVQSCTPDAYLTACYDAEHEPDEDVLAAARAKVWQQRHWILLRPEELDEAGQQLASTAQLVGMMDSGELYPTRNPSPARCPGCPYRPICPDPANTDLIAALFERVPPKAHRPQLEAA